MASQSGSGDEPVQLLDEVLAVVPRLVGRTRSQAEFARSLAALLPCAGALFRRRPEDHGGGAPEHERVDVLSVLADHADDAPPGAHVDAAPNGVEEPGGSAPSESELPIQDYDSLAASQVVPRLATLTHEELRSVQAYETSTRRRQTILHRVAQLLADERD